MKLIVFSDCHIGEYTEGWTDPETGFNTRLLDTLALWDWITQLAKKEKVDAIVFGGDRFRQRRPPYWIRDLGDKKICAITNAHIPLFLLVGNHDMYDKAGTWDSFNGLRVWDHPCVEIINLPTVWPIGDHVALWFVPYGFRDEKFFTPSGTQDRLNILFFHDDVEGVSNYGHSTAQTGILKSWIDRPEWDLVLGGHVHLRQRLPLKATNGFHIGSTLDFASDGPQGAKGAWILTLSGAERRIEAEFVESPAPKIHKFEIEEADLDLNALPIKGNVLQLAITGDGGGKLKREVISELHKRGARSASVSVTPRRRIITRESDTVINVKQPLTHQVLDYAKTKTDDPQTLWHMEQVLSEESLP
jgi:DNA repair exonuclease SbcCD nuclease subunit